MGCWGKEKCRKENCMWLGAGSIRARLENNLQAAPLLRHCLGWSTCPPVLIEKETESLLSQVQNKPGKVWAKPGEASNSSTHWVWNSYNPLRQGRTQQKFLWYSREIKRESGFPCVCPEHVPCSLWLSLLQPSRLLGRMKDRLSQADRRGQGHFQQRFAPHCSHRPALILCWKCHMGDRHAVIFRGPPRICDDMWASRFAYLL